MQAGSPLRGQQGFTYVMVMAALLLLGIVLAVIGPRWADQSQREREAELLRVGRLYAQAIKNYRDATPGTLRQYPPDLDSLLLDTRFVGVRRHIRHLYPDPMDPRRAWGVQRDKDGGVTGVYSLDERMPFMHQRLRDKLFELKAVTRYSEWIFSPLNPS
jgi:type II secretory pathway pseudopilin PulG